MPPVDDDGLLTAMRPRGYAPAMAAPAIAHPLTRRRRGLRGVLLMAGLLGAAATHAQTPAHDSTGAGAVSADPTLAWAFDAGG